MSNTSLNSLSVANPTRVRRVAEQSPTPSGRHGSSDWTVPDLPQDRDRIAADLQDNVVSELFSTGIGLEAIAEGLGRGDQLRVLRYVESLDVTIVRLRSTIAQLERRRHSVSSLRQRVLRAFDEATAMKGLHATVELSGLSGQGIPPDVADDAVAAVRGALARVTGLDPAGMVGVQIAQSDSSLTVDVTGEGHPLREDDLSGALLELRRRAERHGGTLAVEPLSGGCRLRWVAPLKPAR